MLIYRICPQDYLENYEGLGRSFVRGGRWNPAGVPAAYFAASPGIAMLEIANYLSSPRALPSQARLGTYQVKKSTPVEQWSPEQLPADWRAYPYSPFAQEKGRAWLAAKSAVLLVVPSSAVPGDVDNIILFNPSHKKAPGIKLIDAKSEIFSDRIFSRH